MGRQGGSSFANLWYERWLEGTCKCAYDCGLAILYQHRKDFGHEITFEDIDRILPKCMKVARNNY